MPSNDRHRSHCQLLFFCGGGLNRSLTEGVWTCSSFGSCRTTLGLLTGEFRGVSSDGVPSRGGRCGVSVFFLFPPHGALVFLIMASRWRHLLIHHLAPSQTQHRKKGLNETSCGCFKMIPNDLATRHLDSIRPDWLFDQCCGSGKGTLKSNGWKPALRYSWAPGDDLSFNTTIKLDELFHLAPTPGLVVSHLTQNIHLPRGKTAFLCLWTTFTTWQF